MNMKAVCYKRKILFIIFTWHFSKALHHFLGSSLFVLQFVYETNENGDKVVLGKGTYGVVYAGRDLSNQVRIAIKEIPEKDSTYEHFIIFS